jgi:3-oxoacyl-[acyl-carrier protein] reductase
MDLGLQDRAALVTGASKGIGRAIATELVAEGARVAISARSRERIDTAAAEIGALGLVHDSGDLDAVPELVATVERELGPVDVLVCNTGGPPAGAPLELGRDQWQAAYERLVLAPMALIEAVVPGMRERGWGRIVNVVGTTVREPIPGLILSSAHRASTIAAFKTLARDVAADGVTLNSVLPGLIATERIAELFGSHDAALAASDVPAGRIGTVEELAAAAVFLCSARAGYVTGETLTVDGARTASIF